MGTDGRIEPWLGLTRGCTWPTQGRPFRAMTVTSLESWKQTHFPRALSQDVSFFIGAHPEGYLLADKPGTRTDRVLKGSDYHTARKVLISSRELPSSSTRNVTEACGLQLCAVQHSLVERNRVAIQ